MIHGGDIYRNKVKLDFSVNMNPLGIPASVREALCSAAEACGQYPDPKAERLREAIAEREGLKIEEVLPGNGASECIQALCQAFRPKKILLAEPSFYGYRHSAEAVGAEIQEYGLKEEQSFRLDEGILSSMEEGAELMILASPNNPVGNCLARPILEKILKRAEELGMLLLLDECFLEFTEDHDREIRRKWLKSYSGLFLLRAFTKSYSIPGVRLGYLLSGNAAALSKISRQLPEWNISTFSEYAGIAASREEEFLAETRAFLKAEREFFEKQLIGLFQKYGRTIKLYPSDSNFLFLRTELPLYEELLKREILIRDCGNFPGLGEGYYRIAVKNHEENLSFLRELEGILQGDGNGA